MNNNWSPRILDIMTDLETLGNSTTPVLTQLSAVPFRIEDGVYFKEDAFNKFILPQSCRAVGLTCEAGGIDPKTGKDMELTIDWWLRQDPEVFKKVVLRSFLEGEQLRDVLIAFTKWVQDMMKKHNCTQVRVHGNGPAADCVWIRAAYKACDLAPCFNYWDDNCVRTMVDIGVRLLKINPKKTNKFIGDKHNAIDDCIHQILYVLDIVKEIQSLVALKGKK